MDALKPIIRIYRSNNLVSEMQGVRGETLTKHLMRAGVFLDSPCAGAGKCGKCLVYIGAEKEAVLACQTHISDNLDIHLPGYMKMNIAEGTADAAKPRCGMAEPRCGMAEPRCGMAEPRYGMAEPRCGVAKPRYGVALDIGTTTVVMHLVNPETGSIIATESDVNAQRTYGADVISRIKYCAENGHETLTHIIRKQLAAQINEVSTVSGIQKENIEYICIAANTIMAHLAAGYSPVGMGTVPFTPVSLFGDELPAWDELEVSDNAKIYFTPAISAYVGGDITAGIMAAGLEDIPGSVVFIDIGTNGEIVIKDGNTYYCCATAAGPAFEGAEIEMGMAAVTGAINHVWWDEELKFSVIGDGTALGLCGSGLLDVLAVLLDSGAVDESGRLLDADEINHDISRYICEIDSKIAFRLSSDNGGIYVLSSDIRKLQLAKSAIAAGIQTLLHHIGITERQVKSFVLAGGFGSFMDPKSAARIGLFPEVFLPVTKTPGNTAGEGAVIALHSKQARTTLEGIRERCRYIELSTDKFFNEQFIEQMSFKSQIIEKN